MLGSCAGEDTAPTTGDDAQASVDAGTAARVDAAVAAVPGAKFSEIYPLLFPSLTNPRCDSCHAMPASEVSNGKLHMGMDIATAYAALVGKTSVSRKCMGKALVVPGQPDMSLLLQKLGPTPPCGARMPIGGAPLSEEQQQRVRSWIQAGAQNN